MKLFCCNNWCCLCFSDDSERHARMQKVLENRKRKSKSDYPVSIKEEPQDPASVMPDQSDSSLVPPPDKEKLTWDAILPMLLHNCTAVALEPASDPEFDQKDPDNNRMVTALEYGLFSDIGHIYKATLGDLIMDGGHTEQNYKSCNDLINNSSCAVIKLIKYVKQMEDFQKVPQSDQLLLLKFCVFSAILIRSAWFYSVEKDSWQTASGEISTIILKNLVNYNQVYQLHTKFCQKVKTLFKEDERLFSLVQMLCIFNPICPDLSNRVCVSDLHDKYLLLLRHYLEWKFSYNEAPKVFREVINLIGEIKEVSEVHNAIILSANPDQIEPLMLEILDLK